MKSIPVLLAACAALPCFADEPSTDLDTVVVTATRSLQDENHLPAPVTVITREAIERSGARHLVEVLRWAGIAQVSDLFGDGSRATVDLRGFGDGAHSSTLVLLDGRRLNNEDIAAPDLNSVSLKDVERIEIIEGSAGTLYGDQAVGGVINIITRVPDRFRVSGELGGASYGGAAARAAVEQRWTSASARLSVEDRATDNYRDHNALAYKNVLGRLAFDGEHGGMLAELGYVDEDLQTPGALTADEVAANRRQAEGWFLNDFSDTNTGYVRVNWHQALTPAWRAEVDLDHRRSNGAFRLSFTGFPAASDSSQDRDVRAAHPRLIGTLPLPSGDALLTLGLDGEISHYKLVTAFGPQTNKQHQGGAYAQAIVPLHRTVELTLGGRYASVKNEVQDTYVFTTPTQFGDHRGATELGLAWRPAREWRLFARYDGNFRFAKVDEFTTTTATAGSGIVAIRTQTGRSYEAGSEWTLAGLRLRFSGYRLDLRDEIAYDPALFANVNLDPTRRTGLIGEAEYHWSDRVWATFSAQHVKARVDGHDVPLVARNTAKLAGSVALPLDLLGRLELLRTGRRPLAGDTDNSGPALPAYGVVNAGLDWSRGRWSIDTRVNNLLDRRYSEYGVDTGTDAYYPSPERNFSIRARYDL